VRRAGAFAQNAVVNLDIIMESLRERVRERRSSASATWFSELKVGVRRAR
jgi:hypothetical protein